MKHRQISRQKAEKSDEFCNIKNHEQTPELDSHLPQEVEKLEDKSRETAEIVDGYMVAPCHDVDNLLSSVEKKLTKKTANERFIGKAKHCPSSNCLYQITLSHEMIAW